MFKRWESKECSTSSQVKSSVQRAIKEKICASNPALTDVVDDVFPKKTPRTQVKASQHVTLYCRGSEPVFYEQRDGPILPTLRFAHQHPKIWTTVTVDKGAIPYILGGANIMCPGLTNPGAILNPDLKAGDGVVVMCEGKETAIATGVLKMSAKDIKEVNKGVAVECCHFLGDGLFNCKAID